MRTLDSLKAVSVAALIGFAPQAFAGDGMNIVDTASKAGSFQTLLAAAGAAGMVDALEADGPLTVFAPSDDAFAKLPDGTVDALLTDLPKLRQILKYHVVSGKVMSGDVVKLRSAKTLLGQDVSVDATDGVKINDSNVIQADIQATNGVIHVIDSVLMPADDVVDVADSAGSFTILLAAVEGAGLLDVLRGEGPFTVFAPTDEAFAKLPAGTVEALLKDKETLSSILTYHVVAGAYESSAVATMKQAASVQGQALRISTKGGVRVNDANVVQVDVRAANGVIHVIDTVLIPEANL